MWVSCSVRSGNSYAQSGQAPNIIKVFFKFSNLQKGFCIILKTVNRAVNTFYGIYVYLSSFPHHCQRIWTKAKKDLIFVVRLVFYCYCTKHPADAGNKRLRMLNFEQIIHWKQYLRSSTCPLTGFFWLLSHVIYLKLTRVL